MQKSQKRVSHYLLKNSLGEGSYGKVFYSEDLDTNEIRAIKVIENSILLHDRHKTALSREIKIMKDLSHKNIVKLFDHVVSSKHNYLVLEYCPGGDLSKKIKEGGIGLNQTVNYLRQIISALKILKEKDIVHRDLKPANILLTADNSIKLADFGLARTINPHSFAKSCVGTPLYMSPEVVRNLKGDTIPYEHGADIWSVGCIVFELLTGRRPFAASDFDNLIPKIEENLKSNDFLRNFNFPGECINFLQEIFIIEPADRIKFDQFCEHPFVTGLPKIRPVVSLKGIDCLIDDDLYDCVDLTREDALKFSKAVQNVAYLVSCPFILHVKACMLLKAFLVNDEKDLCKIQFIANFDQAQKFRNKAWEDTNCVKLLIDIVIQLCENVPSEGFLSKKHYKQALILLKPLKPQSSIIKLKEAIMRKIAD
jgi:serine/threonine-protein kinase ULK/ATG1